MDARLSSTLLHRLQSLSRLILRFLNDINLFGTTQSVVIYYENPHLNIIVFVLWNLQVELINPAVNGTINVLRTCTKVSSVKRVILTSSMAAVLAPETKLGPNDVVDETFFTNPSFAEERKVFELCFDISMSS